MQVSIIEDEPTRTTAGSRLDPFRRDLFRNGHHLSSAGKQFVALEGAAADPFAPAVRVTVSAVRERPGGRVPRRHAAGAQPRGRRA
ncbi:hypothetical protein ACIF70_41295 [Actinacidiphila glaucinigra]|uniref:hypothetical protein n=1 Tax=Actinacidiphila glaucinigra TaxID=235986 RepID=UPI0037CAF68C